MASNVTAHAVVPYRAHVRGGQTAVVSLAVDVPLTVPPTFSVDGVAAQALYVETTGASAPFALIRLPPHVAGAATVRVTSPELVGGYVDLVGALEYVSSLTRLYLTAYSSNYQAPLHPGAVYAGTGYLGDQATSYTFTQVGAATLAANTVGANQRVNVLYPGTSPDAQRARDGGSATASYNNGGNEAYYTPAGRAYLVYQGLTYPLYGASQVPAGTWHVRMESKTVSGTGAQSDQICIFVRHLDGTITTVLDTSTETTRRTLPVQTGAIYCIAYDISVPAITLVDGDQLGIEVWGRNYSASAYQYTQTPWGGTDTPDLSTLADGALVGNGSNPPPGAAYVELPQDLYYVDPAPSLSSVAPSIGSTAGGTSVTISGTNLTGSTGVTFDGVAATNVVVVNDTTITCTAPAHIVATVDVAVQNPNGNATLTSSFTYYALTTTGFSAHMGETYGGVGSNALTTYNTILDDIVADVAASTAAGKANGWTLYDDQRNLQNGPTTMLLGNAYYRGQANAGASANGLSFTNASAAVTGYMTSFVRSFAPASFGIQLSNNNQATWSTNISSVTNDTSLTVASAWTGATAAYQYGSERVVSASGGATYGYVVLKCTSQNGLAPFYVRIMREPSFGDLVRVDCWETWDNVAHTGTGNGPQELLRAFTTQQTQTTQVAYMLWLLPDTFALYAGQPPANNVAGDFFYAGNVTPFQPTQAPGTLLQACSHQGLSGYGTGQSARASLGAANQPGAGASMSRSPVYGQLWSPTSQQYANTVYLVTRELDYLELVTVAYSDYLGRMPMTSYEAYSVANVTVGGNRSGRVGTARYIKSPVMNPSSTFLSLFPADDGNTYIMVRAGFTVGTAISGATSPVTLDTGTYRVSSGFATDLAPLGFTVTAGEIAFIGSGNGEVWTRRFFLLPVNI